MYVYIYIKLCMPSFRSALVYIINEKTFLKILIMKS